MARVAAAGRGIRGQRVMGNQAYMQRRRPDSNWSHPEGGRFSWSVNIARGRRTSPPFLSLGAVSKKLAGRHRGCLIYKATAAVNGKNATSLENVSQHRFHSEGSSGHAALEMAFSDAVGALQCQTDAA